MCDRRHGRHTPHGVYIEVFCAIPVVETSVRFCLLLGANKTSPVHAGRIRRGVTFKQAGFKNGMEESHRIGCCGVRQVSLDSVPRARLSSTEIGMT